MNRSTHATTNRRISHAAIEHEATTAFLGLKLLSVGTEAGVARADRRNGLPGALLQRRSREVYRRGFVARHLGLSQSPTDYADELLRKRRAQEGTLRLYRE